MASELFLSNWSDILGEPKIDQYIDYEALIASDDEFLCLESLDHEPLDFYDLYE